MVSIYPSGITHYKISKSMVLTTPVPLTLSRIFSKTDQLSQSRCTGVGSPQYPGLVSASTIFRDGSGWYKPYGMYSG